MAFVAEETLATRSRVRAPKIGLTNGAVDQSEVGDSRVLLDDLRVDDRRENDVDALRCARPQHDFHPVHPDRLPGRIAARNLLRPPRPSPQRAAAALLDASRQNRCSLPLRASSRSHATPPVGLLTVVLVQTGTGRRVWWTLDIHAEGALQRPSTRLPLHGKGGVCSRRDGAPGPRPERSSRPPRSRRPPARGGRRGDLARGAAFPAAPPENGVFRISANFLMATSSQTA